MPRLAGFRTSIESAFTIRPRGRERLPCQVGVLSVTLVNNSSECNNRSHADLMHNKRSARRRFGKPLLGRRKVGRRACYQNSYNGLCNRRGLLSCDSKAFEHFTMECCVEQLFRLPTTRILAWNICWLALLPEPIGITSCKPTPRTYPHDAQLDYFRVARRPCGHPAL